MAGFFDIPEEIQAKMREQLEQQRMSMAAGQHDLMRLFDELSKEGLRTLTGIFGLLAASQDEKLAHYFEGIGVAYLKIKHNICVACGESHDLILSTEDEQIDPQPVQNDVDKSESSIAEELALYEKNIEEYNLRSDQVTHELVCKNCGKGYPSLEDRMRRPVDGCQGCHEKAKWG